MGDKERKNKVEKERKKESTKDYKKRWKIKS